jgi:hypothetical protein
MQSPSIFINILLILFPSFYSQGQSKFQWLDGVWKINDNSVYEVWRQGKSNASLTGISFTISNKDDTTVTEEIQLIKEGEWYYYIPDVAAEQEPVRFEITGYSSSGFKAENPLNDFPKIISYQFNPTDGRLKAAISGNGKSIEYAFEKLNLINR